jgi:hypothetical protein
MVDDQAYDESLELPQATSSNNLNDSEDRRGDATPTKAFLSRTLTVAEVQHVQDELKPLSHLFEHFIIVGATPSVRIYFQIISFADLNPLLYRLLLMLR